MSYAKDLPVLSNSQDARVKESPGKQAPFYHSMSGPSDGIVLGVVHLCQVYVC